MNLVSYGGGVNSTAMLIECVNRGIDVDLILFADTGGERPHTYKYVETFSKWLVEHGMHEIITVYPPNENLEENCIRRGVLPALAYGFKTCSQRFKIQPQDKYCNNHHGCKDVWKSGDKVTKLIGFDVDEAHRIRDYQSDKYIVDYPLVDWDMGREDCVQAIEEAGLCQPGKSACFYCPSSKPSEIRQLAQIYPDLADRAMAIEAGAELTSIKGLGRNFAWRDLLLQSELFEEGYSLTPEMVCGCYDG